jgi:RimJ/RimL family protein N-acetyltransferase
VDTEMQMPELIQYVSKKNSSTDAMLLGIFTNDNEQHIGNIKFEPFNSYLKEAWFGILIGNQNYRGKGFGFEIINECMNYMNSNFNLQIFKLGVDAANAPAINLYRRLGFHQEILPEFGREKIVMIKKI